MQASIAFFLANWLAVRLPILPDLDALMITLPLVAYGLCRRSTRTLCSFVAAVLYTYLVMDHELALRLTADQAERDWQVTGVIKDLPVTRGQASRFTFRVSDGPLAGRNLQVTSYHPHPVPRAGESWRLTLRLGEPRGALNFGSFDYEGWLFVKRIHARGYVLDAPAPRLLAGNRLGTGALREAIRTRLKQVVAATEIATFLALILGDTGALSHAQWTRLSETGTTHLLIVSGLHTGLIASLSFLLLRLMGLPMTLVCVGSAAVTIVYASIAGWGLPVQRALVMCLVVLAARASGRQLSLFSQLTLALVAVLIVDPLASLTNGFWLSFGAVWILLYALSGRSQAGQGHVDRMAGVLRAQWAIFAGLAPVLAVTTGKLSLLSMPVNLIAIPWVGVLLVPLLMLALLLWAVWPPAGYFLLQCCGFLVHLLWGFLESMASVNQVIAVPRLPVQFLLLAVSGALILLAPGGVLPRWTAIGLLMLLFIPQDRPGRGDVWLTFIDVGQGLSVLLETSGNAVLYDTGPSAGDRFSAARQMVLPYLADRGIGSLSRLIISHGDNDHAGGEALILDSLAVAKVIRHGRCADHFEFDGVSMTSFSSAIVNGSENDASCLLAVRSHEHSILLTGDIEAKAELALTRGAVHPVTLISVPHHGSASSSTPALLNLTRPEMAVVSSGYRNRFAHPDSRVMARYRARSVRVLNTAETGAIRFKFIAGRYEYTTARLARRAVWRNVHGF